MTYIYILKEGDNISCDDCKYDYNSYHCVDCSIFTGNPDDCQSFCSYCLNNYGDDDCNNCYYYIRNNR